jgi:hypothetical protein
MALASDAVTLNSAMSLSEQDDSFYFSVRVAQFFTVSSGIPSRPDPENASKSSRSTILSHAEPSRYKNPFAL